MSADENRPEDQWPLPPAWMWACQTCADLYRSMKHALEATEEYRLTSERGIDFDPMDSVVSTQIALAQHMAANHADQLPPWTRSCTTCADHRKAASGTPDDPDRAAFAVRFGDEHRARHVFAPPSIVGLY